MPERIPTETRFAEIKRYVAFTAEDGALLRAFRDVVAPHFERITQEFYERIRHHEDAHAVFTDEAQIARLQRSLVRWLERVFGGSYDESYFHDTLKIGRVHVKVGLPQRYMLTAMALIRSSLTHIAEARAADGHRIADAISRLLDLELAIMLESYRDDSVTRIQHVKRLEKQELERSLARIDHRYVNAVEFARALIVGLDRHGIVKLFNREAERVTGFARDEVLGKPFVETPSLDDTEQVAGLRETLMNFFAHPRVAPLLPDPASDCACDPVCVPARAHDVITEPLDGVVRTKSGRSRVVRWHLAYAPADGDDVSVFAMGRDVTDERALVERAKQHDKLAAIGTLAAGLAHEIRNPLNGAQLHVAYLERSLKMAGAHEELLEAIGVLGDEIKRLGSLVSEFLDFARPRPLLVKPLSVQALFERVSQLQSAHSTSGRASLTLDPPPADIEIHADGAKLEQVLLNLVQNAFEAIDPEATGGTVILRARRQPHTATIEVEDNGPGIPPESPIFDAFYSMKPQGTGLGLSITHRIVTDHGGTIDVESRPGRTIFRIILPIEGPPGA